MKNTLGPAPVRSESRGSVLSAQRTAVLELLQQCAAPATSAEIAGHLDLHANTARFHMEALVERGLVKRVRDAPQGPGRPAVRYRAVARRTEPDARVRDFIGLAGALARQIRRTSPAPAAEALVVGTEWARSLDRPSPAGAKLADPVAEVITRLEQLGFDAEPEHVPQTGVARVYRLRRCPLLDVARDNPDVVCNVHLGLVRGTLAEVGAATMHADLESFAEPGACLLRFAS